MLDLLRLSTIALLERGLPKRRREAEAVAFGGGIGMAQAEADTGALV